MKKLNTLFFTVFNPRCIRGIGMYFDSSKAAKWHKSVAANRHENITRYAWYGIFLISTSLWYLCFFWIHFISLYFSNKHPNTQPFKTKTMADILFLGLWVGVKPQNYFQLELFKSPRDNWFNYIFIEEQLTWYVNFNHRHRSIKDFNNDIATLSNKHLFSKLLIKNKLPAISELAFISTQSDNKHEMLNNAIDSQIEKNQDFFIKPLSENSMRGCLVANINSDIDDCSAHGFDLKRKHINLKNKSEIARYLTNFLTILSIEHKHHSGLLFQKLLVNSKEMVELTQSKKLSVIRIITCISRKKFKPKVIYSFLENEISKQRRLLHWKQFQINVDTGLCEIGKIKQWDDIKEIAVACHELYPSIVSLAWDIAICQEGIRVIEGNYGWGTIEPQSITGVGALENGLVE